MVRVSETSKVESEMTHGFNSVHFDGGEALCFSGLGLLKYV